jgi:hypothetical protein
MDARRSDQRDPAIGVLLSLLCPGLGHLYAGNPLTFAVFLGSELWLLSRGSYWLLIPLHVFQAISAGGAVKQRNARRSEPVGGGDIPPPPAAGTGRRTRTDATPDAPPPLPVRPAPPPPPPPQAPAPSLDADAFFAELQAAWAEYRASGSSARQFADRKWRAIRAVHVEGRDEGEALVAAARELAEAGVLTSEEISQLVARVTP